MTSRSGGRDMRTTGTRTTISKSRTEPRGWQSGGLAAAMLTSGHIQLDGKKLMNRDLATVLALLRKEGFLDDDLRFLNVSHNYLDHLPTNHLPLRVQALHIGHNRFVSLIGFEHLPLLERLDVSRNLLRRSWGLSHNINLRHLNLAGNKIRIVEGLEKLKFLESLDLSDNLIRTMEDMRAVSFNDKLRALRLKGNPVASRKNYRVSVLHLLPFVRLLDGLPFFPFARDTTTPLQHEELTCPSHELTYSDIHQSKQILHRILKRRYHGILGAENNLLLDINEDRIRRLLLMEDDDDDGADDDEEEGAGGEEGPTKPALGPSSPEDSRDGGRTRRRYVPSWRCPPNPLPRGWKDYRQLATESMTSAAAGRRKPPPSSSSSNNNNHRKQKKCPPSTSSPPRRRPPAQGIEDWSFARCPTPNTFSYKCHHVIPRPATAASSPEYGGSSTRTNTMLQSQLVSPTNFNEFCYDDEDGGGGGGYEGPAAGIEVLSTISERDADEDFSAPDPPRRYDDRHEERVRRAEPREEVSPPPASSPPPPPPRPPPLRHAFKVKEHLLMVAARGGVGHKHLSSVAAKAGAGRRRPRKRKDEVIPSPPAPPLSPIPYLSPGGGGGGGNAASAISSLSMDDHQHRGVAFGGGGGGGGDAIIDSPVTNSSDATSCPDDGSAEMREIVKMLRDLLLQKRKTIELLMQTSSSSDDGGGGREGEGE